MALPTPAELAEVFHCDPERGVLIWRERPGVVGNRRVAGRVAGSVAANGYRVVTIRPHWIHVHRAIWALVHGAWPAAYIDHVNGDRLDNRIGNLREATMSQNLANRGAQSNSRSGIKGVSLESFTGRWKASIQRDGRTFNLGRYDTMQEAAAAYRAAAERMYGAFFRS
jgi:hypothetical protein